jgi:hypothetical protein
MHRCEDNVEMDLKQSVMVWNAFIWLRIESVAGSCEGGNETSGCKKNVECFDQLSDWNQTHE